MDWIIALVMAAIAVSLAVGIIITVRGTLDDIQDEQKESRERIETLRAVQVGNASVPLPSPQEITRHMADIRARLMPSDGDLRVIRSLAEDAISDSYQVRLLRTSLISIAVVGVAIWIGGAIYQGVELNSVRDESRQTKQEIEGARREAKDAKAELLTFLQEQSDAVVKAKTSALDSVEATRSKANSEIDMARERTIGQVDSSRSQALKEINSQREEAIKEINAARTTTISAVLKNPTNNESTIELDGWRAVLLIAGYVLSLVVALKSVFSWAREKAFG